MLLPHILLAFPAPGTSFAAIRQEPPDSLRHGFARVVRNQQAAAAGCHHLRHPRGIQGYHRQTTGLGFEIDHPEGFTNPRKSKQIRRRVVLGHVARRHATGENSFSGNKGFRQFPDQ